MIESMKYYSKVFCQRCMVEVLNCSVMYGKLEHDFPNSNENEIYPHT